MILILHIWSKDIHLELVDSKIHLLNINSELITDHLIKLGLEKIKLINQMLCNNLLKKATILLPILKVSLQANLPNKIKIMHLGILTLIRFQNLPLYLQI